LTEGCIQRRSARCRAVGSQGGSIESGIRLDLIADDEELRAVRRPEEMTELAVEPPDDLPARVDADERRLTSLRRDPDPGDLRSRARSRDQLRDRRWQRDPRAPRGSSRAAPAGWTGAGPGVLR